MVALDGMVALASQRTPEAMVRLCGLSLDGCAGISGSVATAPDGAQTAPVAGSAPDLLCSRDVGDGAWMVTGSTSWSTAYSAGGDTAPEFTEKLLQRARGACAGGG
jgi:hypothetical protein